MTPEQLRKACNDSIAIVDPEFEPHVYLTLTRSRCPEGSGIRLAGRSGPIGHICIVRDLDRVEGYRFRGVPSFEVVATFKAREILTWLERQGA